jgi:hypothetical protein
LIVGLVLLVFVYIQLVGNMQKEVASPVVVLLGAGLIIAVLTMVVAVAFRCGLHLSGLRNARPLTAIAISAIYLPLLAIFSHVPVETRAVAVSLPTTGQTHHALLMVPIGTLVFAFFVVPLLVSYGVCRYLGSRSSGA